MTDQNLTAPHEHRLSTSLAFVPSTRVVLTVAAILIGFGLRIWGMHIAGDIGDVATYFNHAQDTRHGVNVYQKPEPYPYFPGWLAVEVASANLADALRVPFWQLIRAFIICFDLGVCLAIWRWAALLGGRGSGALAAAAYALNPIAIVVSGVLGQFDAIPTLCAILAARLLMGPPRSILAGLVFGIGVALKPFPLLILPVLLRIPGLSLRQRMHLLVMPVLMVGLICIPYLLWDAAALIGDITGYIGLNDHGIGGVLRSLWLVRDGNTYLPGTYGQELRGLTRWFTLAAIAVVLLVTARQSLPRQAAAVYLAFLVTYGGVSTQYLAWPVAWLAMSTVPIWIVTLYGIGATAGAVGFFSVFWPRMAGIPRDDVQPGNARSFLIGQLIAYPTLIATFVATLKSGHAEPLVRNRFVVGALVILAATAIPVARHIAWLVEKLR